MLIRREEIHDSSDFSRVEGICGHTHGAVGTRRVQYATFLCDEQLQRYEMKPLISHGLMYALE